MYVYTHKNVSWFWCVNEVYQSRHHNKNSPNDSLHSILNRSLCLSGTTLKFLETSWIFSEIHNGGYHNESHHNASHRDSDDGAQVLVGAGYIHPTLVHLETSRGATDGWWYLGPRCHVGGLGAVDFHATRVRVNLHLNGESGTILCHDCFWLNYNEVTGIIVPCLLIVIRK